MKLTVHGASDPGHLRKINEDSWLSEPELGLFVVADGMGGHNAGEVASQLAVEAIHAFIRRTREGENVTWPYGIDPKMSFHANRLATAVRLANRRVFKSGESRDEFAGMGTTVVAILVEDDRVAYVGVGDSRIYLFSGGRLTQLTKDQTWAATIAAEPGAPPIPPGHALSHVLTNVVGARQEVDLQVIERTLLPDEILLLCSDGLREVVTDEQVATALGQPIELSAKAERLIGTVLAGAAPDNVTVLLLQAEG